MEVVSKLQRQQNNVAQRAHKVNRWGNAITIGYRWMIVIQTETADFQRLVNFNIEILSSKIIDTVQKTLNTLFAPLCVFQN